MFAWRNNYISYNGAGGAANDPYWTSVSLLLNYETPQTAITDGSTNNFALTVTGNPLPNQRTPFTGVGASTYYNGTTKLEAPTNAAFGYGTGDFTVEFWVRMNNAAATQIILDQRVLLGGASQTVPCIYTTSSRFQYYVLGANRITSTTPLVSNTWYAVSVCRSGTSTKMFINGVQEGSTYTDTNNYSSTARAVIMSEGDTNGAYTTGFMSNLRLTKGVALYTTTYTPSTAPLTSTANTSLLVTGTNQGQATTSATVYNDQGPNAFTVTATGTPAWAGLTPFTNSYPGSIFYSGGANYLTMPANAAWNLSNSNWTFECWINMTNLTAQSGYFPILTWGTGSFATFRIRSTGINFEGSPSFSSTANFPSTIVINTWYHVALVRSSSTTVTAYLNGVAGTPITTLTSGTTFGSAAAVMNIGYKSDPMYFYGYMSNWRLVNGTAVYTSNFTPSTTPLTSITNTSGLISGNTGSLYDLSNNGNRLTAAQTTQTQIFKYGTQGGLTTTGITTVTDATNLQFTTGDFTIEGWIYRNAAGVVGGIISKGTSTTGWRVRVNASNQLVFAVTAADAKTSTTTIAATTWTYFAWTRSGSTNYMFIDGTQEGSTFTDSTNFNQTNNLLVGSDGVNTTLQGYMDEVRLTKGVARYTASFTAPSSAFPTS